MESLSFKIILKNLNKVANNTLDKCKRQSLIRNSSQNTLVSNSLVNSVPSSELSYRKYENHSSILSKLQNNLKSTRYDKDSSRFDFSSEIIVENDNESFKQSNSIVDLRKKQQIDLSNKHS